MAIMVAASALGAAKAAGEAIEQSGVINLDFDNGVQFFPEPLKSSSEAPPLGQGCVESRRG